MKQRLDEYKSALTALKQIFIVLERNAEHMGLLSSVRYDNILKARFGSKLFKAYYCF